MSSRYTQTLTLRPIPEAFARVYRRRGMEIPIGHSGHDAGALIPYRWRAWHRRYAQAHGLFWMPCPLCDQPFGGHEIGDTIPDPTRAPNGGMVICPACTATRNGGTV